MSVTPEQRLELAMEELEEAEEHLRFLREYLKTLGSLEVSTRAWMAQDDVNSALAQLSEVRRLMGWEKAWSDG